MSTPFPDARPLSELIAGAGTARTRDETAEIAPPYAFIGITPVCVWVRFREPLAPGGSVVFGGTGETSAAAVEAARRNWRTWRRAARSHPPELPVDGREYQRRLRNRKRRR